MSREKGSGIRYPIKRVAIKGARYNEPDWSKHESILGYPLNAKVRTEINLANELYAWIGPGHDPRQTILSSTITPLIDDWMAASNKLRSALSSDTESPEADIAISKRRPKRPSRANVIVHFWGEHTVRRIGKMLPLQFLDIVAAAALDAGKVVSDELTQMNASMKNDLWSAWVALIARALVSEGIKVSASGINKWGNASPFVMSICQFEKALPSKCRRYSDDASAAKTIQTSLRKTRHLNRKDLFLVLAGYGSQLVKDYPGVIEKLSSEKTEKVMDLLQAKLRKLKIVTKS
jgi:hypothetical protein